MIYDKLENFKLYAHLAPAAWEKIEAFLKTVTPETESRRHYLDGDLVLADTAIYQTKPLEECKVELHGRYVDIQVVLEGDETLCCVPTDDLEVLEAFDAERDRGFFVYRPGRETRLEMSAGTFAVFLPGEGHLTAWHTPANTVRKVVFKIDRKLLTD